MTRKKRIYFKTEEVITKTKTGWVELETDFVQMYHNAWTHLVKLNRPVSLDFLLWIISRVDENNMFSFNQRVFHDFNEALLAATGNRTYTMQSVKFALKELKGIGVIRAMERGHYQVNPGIFWTAEQDRRIETVKVIDQMESDTPAFTIGSPVQKIEDAQALETTKGDSKQTNKAAAVIAGMTGKMMEGVEKGITRKEGVGVMTQPDDSKYHKVEMKQLSPEMSKLLNDVHSIFPVNVQAADEQAVQAIISGDAGPGVLEQIENADTSSSPPLTYDKIKQVAEDLSPKKKDEQPEDKFEI